MEELLGILIIAIAVLVVLGFGFRMVGTLLYWLLAMLSFLLFLVLDILFSARLLPGAPWVMWCLCGGLLGAACSGWIIAPLLRLRSYRPLIILSPFIIIAVLALITIIIK